MLRNTIYCHVHVFRLSLNKVLSFLVELTTPHCLNMEEIMALVSKIMIQRSRRKSTSLWKLFAG